MPLETRTGAVRLGAFARRQQHRRLNVVLVSTKSMDDTKSKWIGSRLLVMVARAHGMERGAKYQLNSCMLRWFPIGPASNMIGAHCGSMIKSLFNRTP